MVFNIAITMTDDVFDRWDPRAGDGGWRRCGWVE